MYATHTNGWSSVVGAPTVYHAGPPAALLGQWL
jgi:hypothetical protein